MFIKTKLNYFIKTKLNYFIKTKLNNFKKTNNKIMSTKYVYKNKVNYFILDQTCDRKKENIVLIFNTPNAYHNNIHPKMGDESIINQLSQSFPVYYYNNIRCLDDIIQYLQILINCNKKIVHLIIQAHGDPQGIVFGIEYSITQFRSLDKKKVSKWFKTWVHQNKIKIENKQLEELTVFFVQKEVDGNIFLDIKQQDFEDEPILKKYKTIIIRAIKYLQVSTQYVHLDNKKDKKTYFMRAIPLLKELLLPNSSIFIHACSVGKGGSFSDNFCNRLSLNLPNIEIYGAEDNISIGDVYTEQIIYSTLLDNGIKMVYYTDQYPIYTFYSIRNTTLHNYRFGQSTYTDREAIIINVFNMHDESDVFRCYISKSILLHNSKYIQTFVLKKVSETKKSIPPRIIQEIVNMFNTTKSLFVVEKKYINDLFSRFAHQECGQECEYFLQLKSSDTPKKNYITLFCEKIKHVNDRLKLIYSTLIQVTSIIHKINEKMKENKGISLFKIDSVFQFFSNIKLYIKEYSSFLINYDHLRYTNIQTFNQFFYNYTYTKLKRIIHLDHYRGKMADDAILLNLKIVISQINEFDAINDNMIEQIDKIIKTGQCLELVINDLKVSFGNKEEFDFHYKQHIDLVLGNFITYIKKELCKQPLLLSQNVMRLPMNFRDNPIVSVKYETIDTELLQYPYFVQNLKIFLIDNFTPEFIIERLNDYKFIGQMFGEIPNQHRLTHQYVKQFLQNYDIFKNNISDISTDFCIQNSKEWKSLNSNYKDYLFEYKLISEKDLNNIKFLVDEKSSEKKIQSLLTYVDNNIDNMFFLDKGLYADEILYVFKDINGSIGILYKPKKNHYIYDFDIEKGFCLQNVKKKYEWANIFFDTKTIKTIISSLKYIYKYTRKIDYIIHLASIYEQQGPYMNRRHAVTLYIDAYMLIKNEDNKDKKCFIKKKIIDLQYVPEIEVSFFIKDELKYTPDMFTSALKFKKFYDAGDILYYGKGVKKDDDKAIEYFKKDKSITATRSQRMIGQIVLDKAKQNLKLFHIVKKHDFDYRQLYEERKLDGITFSKYIEKKSIEIKKEINEKDLLHIEKIYNFYKQAEFWFQKSAMHGDSISQFKLATLFNLSREKKRKWLLKSSYQNNHNAQFALYEHLLICQIEYKEFNRIFWLFESALGGNRKANREIAKRLIEYYNLEYYNLIHTKYPIHHKILYHFDKALGGNHKSDNTILVEKCKFLQMIKHESLLNNLKKIKVKLNNIDHYLREKLLKLFKKSDTILVSSENKSFEQFKICQELSRLGSVRNTFYLVEYYLINKNIIKAFYYVQHICYIYYCFQDQERDRYTLDYCQSHMIEKVYKNIIDLKSEKYREEMNKKIPIRQSRKHSFLPHQKDLIKKKEKSIKSYIDINQFYHTSLLIKIIEHLHDSKESKIVSKQILLSKYNRFSRMKYTPELIKYLLKFLFNLQREMELEKRKQITRILGQFIYYYLERQINKKDYKEKFKEIIKLIQKEEQYEQSYAMIIEWIENNIFLTQGKSLFDHHNLEQYKTNDIQSINSRRKQIIMI